jgi:hypothetical protein
MSKKVQPFQSIFLKLIYVILHSSIYSSYAPIYSEFMVSDKTTMMAWTTMFYTIMLQPISAWDSTKLHYINTMLWI